MVNVNGHFGALHIYQDLFDGYPSVTMALLFVESIMYKEYNILLMNCSFSYFLVNNFIP